MLKKRIFAQGDWVTIKYGEYAERYGKIAMLGKDGRYSVIPYDESDEPAAITAYDEAALELIEPYKLTRGQLKDLLHAETFYEDISAEVFPPFNIKPTRKYTLTGPDIKTALENINKRPDCLEKFKEWFWLILNILYEKLEIEERYREDFFSDGPDNDDDAFSVVYGLCEKLYWRLEERLSKKEENDKYIIHFEQKYPWDRVKEAPQIEESAYKIVCEDIISRIDAYEHNKGLPMEEWIYSKSQKRHLVSRYDEDEDLKNASEEALAVYKRFVLDLYSEGDLQALKVLAWSYYEGRGPFEQNWSLSEKYLQELFNKTADPYAANSLGYIYYYGRNTGGNPNYERAFRYFNFGAVAGVDESIYKSADMLIDGKGVPRNVDMGLNLLVDGYRRTLEEFCQGHYDSKFADFALRMGNVARDGLIYGMGIRDAYKFYLEARYAIGERRANMDYYGDDAVERRINKEMELICEKYGMSFKSKQIKADFPLFINYIFEDKFPLKVEMKISRDGKGGTLTVKRFRMGSELIERGIIPNDEEAKKLFSTTPILAAYPELDWVELTDELSWTLEGIEMVKKPEKPGPFLCDGFRKNDTTNALEFFAANELIAAVDAKWYISKIRRN